MKEILNWEHEYELSIVFVKIMIFDSITPGLCKFGIIVKWKICWIWDNGQEFCNFEESLSQDMLFDTKTCYWKVVFAPMFWQYIFSFIVIHAEHMQALKYKRSIHSTFFLLPMGH